MTSARTTNYAAIFGWLVAVTALEIGAVYMGLPRRALILVLLATAAAKALLVAVYFMHLGHERRWVWALPGIPLALGLIFLLALMPDIAWHWTMVEP